MWHMGARAGVEPAFTYLQYVALLPLGYRADDHVWGVIGPTPSCYLSPLNHTWSCHDVERRGVEPLDRLHGVTGELSAQSPDMLTFHIELPKVISDRPVVPPAVHRRLCLHVLRPPGRAVKRVML